MSPATPPDTGAGRLARVVGVPGAVLMGLGSILGTGVFVSVGLASCLGLAFWVDPAIWGAGLALVAVGLVWQRVAKASTPPVRSAGPPEPRLDSR